MSSLVITYTRRDLRVVTSSRKYTAYCTINLSYGLFMQRQGNCNYRVWPNLH